MQVAYELPMIDQFHTFLIQGSRQSCNTEMMKSLTKFLTDKTSCFTLISEVRTPLGFKSKCSQSV